MKVNRFYMLLLILLLLSSFSFARYQNIPLYPFGGSSSGNGSQNVTFNYFDYFNQYLNTTSYVTFANIYNKTEVDNSFVPYTGATKDVDLGNNSLKFGKYTQYMGSFAGYDTLIYNYDSGYNQILFNNSLMIATNILALNQLNPSEKWTSIDGMGGLIFHNSEIYGTEYNIHMENDGLNKSMFVYTSDKNLFIGNITAPNICYSNGTNCVPSTGGSSYNQSLNTTDNVTFNKVNSGNYTTGNASIYWDGNRLVIQVN